MEIIYPFDVEEQGTPNLGAVGGKALSLIFMTGRGLPVPPGFVLSVEYFRPWLEDAMKMEEFRAVVDGPPHKLKAHCDQLKARCKDKLKLDDDSVKNLRAALKKLRGSLYAVRSSSPEEDLAGASFAGGYETTLGVKADRIEDAIRHSFISCFDERVFLYKKERGFALNQPRIAVIVQLQVNAESAGVAFSLNPVNNCFDEAVVNGNFGLGESVVSGLVTPDSFIVDKVSRTVIDSKVGNKETSIELVDHNEGGTRERSLKAPNQACINEKQILEIVDLVEQAAEYYGRPIDIEWAYERANGTSRLHLLQARPITAFIPIPDAMQTKPGEHRRLYFDVTLIKQGIHTPFSVLGEDYFDACQRQFLTQTFGREVVSVKDGLYFNLEGRCYSDVSKALKWQGVTKLAKTMRTTDSIAVAILESISEEEYACPETPACVKGLTLSIIMSNLGLFWSTFKAYWDPNRYLVSYEEEHEQYVQDVKDLQDSHPPLRDQMEKSVDLFLRVMHYTLPMTAAAEWARSSIWNFFQNEPKEIQDKLAYLERSLDNNITVAMGLDMFQLAQHSEIAACTSGKEFSDGLLNRSFSPEFLYDWDCFVSKFGCRCPFELDIASPRPCIEDPGAFFEQLKLMSKNDTDAMNPKSVFLRARKEREEAFHSLRAVLAEKQSRSARKFDHCYKVLATLGGFREIHKYFWILGIYMLRKRVLKEAESLVKSGRIERVDEVFALHFHELERALEDPSLSLRPLMEKNMEFRNRARHIREYPACFDSRGKILRPPRRSAGPGELVGNPISTGLVRGRVKVLRAADEKPLLPGEILAARATDPGWTPLFVNAGGIILEVGGLLQHGALVAREYGKPCVAGIENVLDVLKDGQLVEVDGANGIVRTLDEEGTDSEKEDNP